MSRNSALKALALALLLHAGIGAAATVNINTATPVELAETLTGIGEARAEAIVAYRKKHGPFRKIEDLQQVEGIGPHIVELNRDVMRATAQEGAER